MYSAIRESILSRLTGSTPSQIGDILTTQMKTRQRTGTVVEKVGILQLPEFLQMQVPVYPYRLEGTNWDALPAVSVRLSNLTPRDATTFNDKDKIVRDVPGTNLKVTFADDGTVLQGAGLKTQRPSPEHTTYEWAIRVWARDEAEMALLTQEVMSLLGHSDYLQVVLHDGTVTTVDTEMDTPTPPIEIAKGMLEDFQGEYSQIIPFVVEGYLDNSHLAKVFRTIRSYSMDSAAWDGVTPPEDLDTILFAITNPDMVEDPD